MPTSYTSLLGYALPVTGELDGTWGTTVNNSITQLVEDSVAGVATTSVTAGDWTLTTTGSGAANEARCAIIIPTGTPGVSRNIIAPSKSKAYLVVNQSDAAVVLKGAATTGVTIATGTKALAAWNGSDFVVVGTADPGNFNSAVSVVKGGTGQTSYTDGQLLIGNSSGNTLTKATLTQGSGVTITNGNGSITIAATATGDVTAAGNNAFTGANTFYNATGQTFGTGTSTQDGIILAGRAGGTNTYRATLKPDTLSASRTVTLPDGGGNYTLGYKNIPAVGTQTGSYSIGTADVGKYVQVGTGGSITIPNSTFAEGDAVLICNNTTGNITITCNTTSAYIAGTNSSKASVFLATRGLATILFLSSTVCVISGNVS